jgi:HTH-type transcriptional regulator, sugar sensing transcriptional regulator
MEAEKILTDLGLSQNEAKIYIELLNLKQATVVEIAKKAKIYRTNVYDSLEKLIEKGLVAYIVKEGTKLYEAANPENLLNLLKEKEIALRQILPTFMLNYSLAKKTTNTYVYEGAQAIRNTLNKFLEYKQPIYVYGIPKQAIETIGPFITDYHKKRIKEKVMMYHIYNEDAQERINYLNTVPYTEAKYLKSEFNSSISTNICGDSVALFFFSKTPLVILIENHEIASSYKKYFDLLWSVAKK